MATIASLIVRIGGDSSGLRREIENSQRQIKRAFGSAALGASETAVGIISAMGAAMTAAGVASIKMAADMQTTKTALAGLLGSVESAEKLLGDLSELVSRSTFSLPGLTESARNLIAFKFAAEDVVPVMTILGDAAATLGIRQEGINRIIVALGQIKAKGKLATQEVNQLINANISAWALLADSMGISVAEVQKMVADGAIDATTAINGILEGMQKNFAGGMSRAAQEINGILGGIESSVSTIAVTIGDKLIESLSIKEHLKELSDSLSAFSNEIKTLGINEALKNLIPPELGVNISMFAEALVGTAVGALIIFGGAILKALVPIAPFIAAGALLGALAFTLWKAWEPLGELFSSLWAKIVNDTRARWSEMTSEAYAGAKKVLEAVRPLLELFGGKMQTAMQGWISDFAKKAAQAGEEAKKAAEESKAINEKVKKAFEGVKSSLTQNALEMKQGASTLKTAFTGITSTDITTSATGGKTKKGVDEAVKAWEKLENEAIRASKAIEREWVQLTNTQIEQLDRWKKETLENLENTKAANKNYQSDLLRLEEIYIEKRKKIWQGQERERKNIYNRAADMARNFEKKQQSFGLTGSAKDTYEMQADYEDAINSIERKYAELELAFRNADEASKEAFRKAWNEKGIIFEDNVKKMVEIYNEATKQFEKIEVVSVSFKGQAAKEVAQEGKILQQKLTDYAEEGHKNRADMQAAYIKGDLDAYKNALNDKAAAELTHLAGQKELMDLYNKAAIDAQMSHGQIMARIGEEAYGGLQEGIKGLIDGTKSWGEAFRDLGVTVANVIAQMIAQMIAAKIMMSVFGLFAGGGLVGSRPPGVSGPTGSNGGFYKNYASGGAIYGPGTSTSDSILAWLSNGEYVINARAAAMVGMDNLDKINQGFIPFKYNTGGRVVGDSLNRVSFAAMSIPSALPAETKIPLGRNRQSGSSEQPANMHFSINAIDGKSVERWLENGAGQKFEKYFVKRGREFAAAKLLR